MQNVVAFANNDVITVAWSFGKKLDGCMGFAVYRIDAKGKETPLPAVAVFPGSRASRQTPARSSRSRSSTGRTSTHDSIAEKTGSRTFRYKIVPARRQAGRLEAMPIPQVTSNEVEITSRISDSMQVDFNRGLISTQRIARALQRSTSKKGLLATSAIATDPLRASLSGDMVEALSDFVGARQGGGKLYAALYELHDEELVTAAWKGREEALHRPVQCDEGRGSAEEPLVKKATKPKKVDGNLDARNRLTKTAEEDVTTGCCRTIRSATTSSWST